MQRQMPTQQQNLAGNGHGRWTNANATLHHMALQGRSFAQLQPQQKQFYSAAPNSFLQASNNLVPPTLAPRTAAPVPVTNSSQYANTAAPQRGIPAVGSFSQPASKPMDASTDRQAMSENNTYAAQPPQLGIRATEFFSLSEQELDEVLSSLADPQPTSHQSMPTTNAAASQAAQFIPLAGAANAEQPSSHPTTFGTVTNASPVYGNAQKAPATPPANGAQAIHISVPAGAEILKIRKWPLHPGAYEVFTTAGTFRAYGQAPVVDQQPQRQPQ